MKIEMRYCSAFAQSAGPCDMRPVPSAISEHIHQQAKFYLHQEREADRQAVQAFCKFAGKALSVAKPLCADVRVEITEWCQGEIAFEMQELYLSKDTPDKIKQILTELVQKADAVLINAGAETVQLLLSYKLSH